MVMYKWRGILASEGEMTGDGRHIEPGALDLTQTPSPLQFVRQTGDGGHSGAVTVGNITMMERRGNDIYGEGTFRDTDDAPEVLDSLSLIVGDFAKGVSVDLDSMSFELLINPELFEESDDDEREDGKIKLFGVDVDDEMFNVTAGRIRGATLVSIPAFANAYIEVLDEDGNELSAETVAEFAGHTVEADLPSPSFNLTASAPPPVAAVASFQNPNLDRVTPLTYRDGRVFGHIAPWDSCHVGFDGQCITAPKENGDYSWFHVSEIQTDDGPISVGRLTYGGGHAPANAAARPAMQHYDDVGTTAAYVRVGEDEHGIWFSGVLADGLSDGDQRGFLSSPLSGDWRRVGGQLRLVAACSVNTPGFPIARVASGQQTMLVASAGQPTTVADAAAPSADDIARRVVEMMREDQEAKDNAELAALLDADVAANRELAMDAIAASVHVDAR